MTKHLRLGLALAAALAFPARAFAQADVVEYYHLDALGNVMAVSNAAGAEIESHDYLPFGEEWCGSAVCGAVKAGQPKRFTGKERDAETGLDYFGARCYRANLGRFTTIDPVYTWKENLVDPQRWNRYAYVRNNPLKYVDPDGRVLLPALLVAWGAVELGLQLYDSYATVQTLTDPNASFQDKAISGGGFLAGAIAPGGGYGAAGKTLARKVDKAGDFIGPRAPELVRNPKHHPKSRSPQPDNAADLYANAKVDDSGVRWSQDKDGVIHRFSRERNGESHWNGSTAGERPIRTEVIPREIRKAFEQK